MWFWLYCNIPLCLILLIMMFLLKSTLNFLSCNFSNLNHFYCQGFYHEILRLMFVYYLDAGSTTTQSYSFC